MSDVRPLSPTGEAVLHAAAAHRRADLAGHDAARHLRRAAAHRRSQAVLRLQGPLQPGPAAGALPRALVGRGGLALHLRLLHRTLAHHARLLLLVACGAPGPFAGAPRMWVWLQAALLPADG